ncbi:type IV pilus secretin PilQ family protein [Motiliproteus sediminis]|uniref:type IV pilus secretin PilQ family protein n=1 Tax=Motiliproteus sediminis TaxID=1468178 RepID=UPI001FEABEE4|nr:type IV pilus secretin PilQ family protein [Motiliproteus sediminis]
MPRVKRTTSRWTGALMAMVASMLLSVVAHAEVKIVDTSFVSLPGNRMEVRIDFDQPPPLPRTYMIENPARVVLDLFDVVNGLSTKSVDIKSGQVDSLNIAEVKGRVRMIANLYESAEYDTYVEGNSLFVVFGSGATAAMASVHPQVEEAAPAAPMGAPKRTQVQGIDFRRIEGDLGRVIISMTDAKAGVDIVEEGANVVVNLIGAQLPVDLEQRIDVQDFSTPVLFVDALGDGNNASILIKPTAQPYDYLAYQSDNQLVVDFKPVSDFDAAERQRERFPYTGEKLSLNFQDIDIRSVLQIIADVTDMNLVVSDTVAGNITLRLKNVPWDQALELVLKTKSLDKRVVGNVMMVAPASEIAERERFEIETNKQVQELAPLQTEFLQVNYAKASDIVAMLGAEQGLLSERGSVKADPRTNLLLIKDTDNNISKVRRALKKLDVAVRQVMIEARIVTINSDFTKDLGVKWGAGYINDRSNNRSLVIGGNAPGDTAQAGGGGALTLPAGLNVDLGATTVGASNFAIGIGTNSALLQMELSALESDGKGEVVSQPKIITANGKQARIQSGEEIPFQTVEDGEVNVEFKEVVLALDVTPQITPDNRLILDLKVNQDTRGEALPNGEVGINTNELETQVLVDNGETVVLGGVFEKTSTSQVTKVPLLGDIPFIGKLFRRTLNIDSKDELLIFITPRIIEESVTAR